MNPNPILGGDLGSLAAEPPFLYQFGELDTGHTDGLSRRHMPQNQMRTPQRNALSAMTEPIFSIIYIHTPKLRTHVKTPQHHTRHTTGRSGGGGGGGGSSRGNMKRLASNQKKISGT
jgi:hypothetical protein